MRFDPSLSLGLGLGGAGDAAIPLEPLSYIFKAFAPDGSGAELAGEGITFTAAGSAQPGDTGESLNFDGSNDVMSATVSFDIQGKTLLVVANPTDASAAQGSIVTLMGPSSSYVQIESRSTGFFYSRHRSSGIGATTTSIDPITPKNALVDMSGAPYLAVIRYGANIVNLAGAVGGVKTPMTAGSKPMTSVRLGQSRLTDFQAMEFYGIGLLDGITDDLVNRAIAEFETAFGVVGPIMTPYLLTEVLVFGDSIAVGLNTTPSNNNGFIELTTTALNAKIDKDALADAQMAPFEEANSTKIAAAFSNVTNNAGVYTGKSLVIAHYGVNDYRRNVPIGTLGDTTDQTVYGAMKLGLDNIKTHAPTIPVVMTLPFFIDDEIASGVPVENAVGHTLQDYRDAIQAFCESRDVTYVDLFQAGINEANSATYMDDGLHPNNAGHILGHELLLETIMAGVAIPT